MRSTPSPSHNAGNTNAGAIATVACDSDTTKTDYTAIAGGVQTVGTNDTNAYNTPVASSFPGRMDWSTNKPRENRLDGWIVQFGGNAGATSDKDPEKVNVWALCVPRTDIPVNRIDAGARLVAGEHVVAPGLDHVVGRRADVRDIRLAQQREHRIDQPLDRVHRAPIGGASRRARVEGAEQLERGVDEMELHLASRGYPPWMVIER